jgi:hypothetical protein
MRASFLNTPNLPALWESEQKEEEGKAGITLSGTQTSQQQATKSTSIFIHFRNPLCLAPN